ncbi:hypothetical protein [Glycomyces terrestris]|uniref:Aerobactin siderophore biosynthesis IucA/IucC-like C-terminal domain-containing protein n=1 Tax=Glycomyces terrestris TaxID=2493553 RepID=A0A426UXX0_9ACTN|nr:hypothetical protein [Glycomyces terrestris]RRR99412.1 hypothetical protein EIW28_11915 [Glycomyces terrestris]
MRLAIAEALPGAPAFADRPVPAPHPMRALRAVAARVEHEVSPHPIAGIRAWLYGDRAPSAVAFPAVDLASGERVEELMAAAAALWGGSAHANAALAWKTYCYWTLAPAVLGYVAARRVPVMDAANTVFAISDEAPMFSVRQVRPRFLALPHDPCAGHPDVEVVPNEGVLLDRLRATVFEGHLGPVLDAFLARVRVGRRTLLGSLASGLSYAVAAMAPVVPDPDEVLAKTLLDAFDVAHLVDVSTDEAGRLLYRRRTCCLALTIEGGRTCSTCCVQSDRC